jgi:hypothetical protein
MWECISSSITRFNYQQKKGKLLSHSFWEKKAPISSPGLHFLSAVLFSSLYFLPYNHNYSENKWLNNKQKAPKEISKHIHIPSVPFILSLLTSAPTTPDFIFLWSLIW